MNEKKTYSSMSATHKVTIAALLMTVGIVFGDIGTSPLYVMKAIVAAVPVCDADYIIGAVSCIFWTLTLQTTLKYVVVALKADNRGEGGILALYSLLRRSPHRWLYVIAAIGAGTLIADGVITPAVTVTSAVEGLRVLQPSAPVVPLVIVIITLIFMIQRNGTKAIGRMFGPFMLLWFLMLGTFGVLNLHHAPRILNAFNPVYAVRLLAGSPEWFVILGAVFLCTTGAEALYSDLGHCGRRNITWAWSFVKVMLVLNYLGQGAWLIGKGEGVAGGNPFYEVMPEWFLPIGIIMSTGAAIIASQALLSGSFTIFSEAMGLGFWPRMRIKYPTPLKGQLYIPLVNAFLYIGCIVTVLMFRTSSAMEAAYGLAITVTMLMTTLLLGFWMRRHGAPRWMAACFCLVFILVEGVFLVANLTKFIHGGWYTLLLAAVVTTVMLVWRKAVITRERYVEYLPFADSYGIISAISADMSIARYASNLVYFSKSEDSGLVESKLIYSIVNKQPKRADRYWIVRVCYDDAPETLEYDYTVLVSGLIYSIGIRLGFRVEPQVSVYLRQVIQDIVAAGDADITSCYPSLRERGITGDFRFVMIHRQFSPSSACRLSERRVMQAYGWLSHIGVAPERAMGLDTTSLSVETVPLIIDTVPRRRIVRRHGPHTGRNC